MKQNLFAGCTLLLFLMGCAAQRKTAAIDPNLEGNWTLAVFHPNQKKTLAEVFGERVVELQFNGAKNTVSGTTGCNRFSGTYTADTANFSFARNLALTKMACPGYNEQIVLDAMNRVNRYRLIESELELMQDTVIVMIFAKKPQ